MCGWHIEYRITGEAVQHGTSSLKSGLRYFTTDWPQEGFKAKVAHSF
jgi:hypothetical protein